MVSCDKIGLVDNFNLNLEPREYQHRIVSKAVGLLGDHRSVLIQSPTGSGKTDMGLMATIPFAREGWKIGWAAMRRNLLTQVYEEARKIGYPFPITTISMFDKQPPQCDFLIVDEAHHDATRSMENIHAHIQPKKVIGLSATPQRQDKVGLCFEKTVNDAGIGELIRLGYLSRYNHFSMLQYTPLEVARLYVAERERWGKSLIFFRTHQECLSCLGELNRLGFHKADVITGSTDREMQLEAFSNGDTEVVINMMVLTEGFDCPDLSTVFIRDSSRNPTIQMGGRVFRKMANIAAKNVVQSANTHWPFVRTAEAVQQFKRFGTEWRSVTVSDNLNQVAMKTRAMMIRAAQAAFTNGQNADDLKKLEELKKHRRVWDPDMQEAEQRRQADIAANSDYDESEGFEE